VAKLKDNSGESIRPPVVAVLGHIDHGKSTLIDAIRKTNITGKEAGGITQHVGSYEVRGKLKDGKDVQLTILDTPGHEAFESLRTRCAGVADIAVLIVSAEDGVKPQTVEVYKYIKESSLPYVVAITKIDKPSADIERTKQNLAENEIYVEGYGGDVPVIALSAKTGQGVDDLLDMIFLMAQMDEKTGDKETLGSGIIIETRMDSKRGTIAVGIIKNGTVRRSLFAASEGSVAPIRFLLDSDGNTVEELSFSSPVQITGWDKMPQIGAEFRTFLKKEDAQSFADEKAKKPETRKMSGKAAEGISSLPLVVKADTSGSLEVLLSELGKLSRERIAPQIIASSVGSINENDVKSAQTTQGSLIIGFHTKIDSQAALLAERSKVTIITFNIIYELTDKIKELLTEREPRIEVEEIASSAKVLKLFGSSKGKQVLGGRVLTGVFKRGANLKILRRDVEIGRGKIRELQQAKIDTDGANEGTEFGAMIESKIDIAPGDVLNAVNLVTK